MLISSIHNCQTPETTQMSFSGRGDTNCGSAIIMKYCSAIKRNKLAIQVRNETVRKNRQVAGGSRAGEEPTIKGPRGVSEGMRLLYPDYGGGNGNL